MFPKLKECSAKFIIPLVCYVFQDGPWRDSFVRLGHDPRADASSRMYATFLVFCMHGMAITKLSFSYQRVYFRNLGRGVERTPILNRRSETRYDIQKRNPEALKEKSGDQRILEYSRTLLER
jgi:general transcription factor 3C polypeptide 5 (transcription factor C subunit 1)